MLIPLVTRVVHYSTRRAPIVVGLWAVVTLLAALYVARHFAIDTDVSKLIDSRSPWAQRDSALDAAFPARNQLTLVVVQAGAPELAERAARDLAARLSEQHDVVQSVVETQSGDYFARQALLYASTSELTTLRDRLKDATPLLRALAHDPSLRGLSNLLSVSLAAPLETGQFSLADSARLFGQSAQTVEAVLAGQEAGFSWRRFVTDEGPGGDSYSLFAVHPRPDYGALQAGARASERIRGIATELDLPGRYGAHVGLTGPIPLGDEEFASIAQGAALNAVLTILTVICILWLALRSLKMVVAVFVTLATGLVITAALGLAMVGALNMISVAFAVLFVGIGVDFSIQFGMRLRSERAVRPGLLDALDGTARSIAIPLTLAAVATAASFLSFLPTEYRGLAELGQIAGVGILLVALPGAITLFPALVVLLAPRAHGAAPGLPALAPLDAWCARWRRLLLAASALAIGAGLLLLPHLEFDADPLHLKDPQSESMRALALLKGDPQSGIDDIQLLAPTLTAAQASAHRLSALPEVARALTIADLVPDDQDTKLALIAGLGATLAPILGQERAPAAPDAIRVAALRNASGALANAAADHPGPGAEAAQRLAQALGKLARATPQLRDRAEIAFARPLAIDLENLAGALAPERITLDSLPAQLRAQWLTQNGEALVEISPRLNPTERATSNALLTRFCEAVLRVEPRAAGGPISVQGSAETIVHSFYQAAAWSLVSVALLLWLALHRITDVLRTLLPLLVSALVTLEICAGFHIALNFANIIALPLLLGVGVAFKIYYVVAWRGGQSGFLQSGLTEAVVLSAATTATAFGSLWLSHHAGTSSMGALLALSLACTLIGAVLFQPILMGAPPASAESPRS
jgi:hopanoid biosynthesis associated RND transporter like protein HpnN